MLQKRDKYILILDELIIDGNVSMFASEEDAKQTFLLKSGVRTVNVSIASTGSVSHYTHSRWDVWGLRDGSHLPSSQFLRI